MLNVLSTPTFDPAGYIEIDVADAQAPSDIKRRVNRTPTLDGGAAINDFGFSDADRTIELRWQNLSRSTDDAVSSMVQSYQLLQVSTRDGVFLAAPELYAPRNDESSLRLLVIEKLSE
jgi:hypothetical protein